jgi:membrane-bound metal-dependent hydrolase YbcI (DUF457 family)
LAECATKIHVSHERKNREKQAFSKRAERTNAIACHYRLIKSFCSLKAESEENKSFAVGHIAFAFLSSKASATLLKTKLNIQLALTLSVIPDIDILIQKYLDASLQHRGPTHSVIVAFIVFAPFFVVYRRKAVPYFVALIQHSLVGDFIAGGQIQLLWPLTNQFFGMTIEISSLTNIMIEWTAFLASMAVMLITKDFAVFIRQQKSNLILAIPTFTVLLPPILSYPLDVPILLVPPHVVYAVMFSAAIIVEIFAIFKDPRQMTDLTLRKARNVKPVAEVSWREPMTAARFGYLSQPSE